MYKAVRDGVQEKFSVIHFSWGDKTWLVPLTFDTLFQVPIAICQNIDLYLVKERHSCSFVKKTRESWILICNSPTISVFRLIRLPHISYRAFSTSFSHVNCLISLSDCNDVRHRFIREQGRESYQLEIMKENLYPGHVWNSRTRSNAKQPEIPHVVKKIITRSCDRVCKALFSIRFSRQWGAKICIINDR